MKQRNLFVFMLRKQVISTLLPCLSSIQKKHLHRILISTFLMNLHIKMLKH